MRKVSVGCGIEHMIEYKTPDRTIDDVLRDYESIFRGRTRYAGQKPRDDELLVAEIKRLREALADSRRISHE